MERKDIENEITEEDRKIIGKVLSECGQDFVNDVDRAIKTFKPAASGMDEFEGRTRKEAILRLRINAIKCAVLPVFDHIGVKGTDITGPGYAKLLSELNIFYCCEKLAYTGVLKKKARKKGERQGFVIDKLGRAALERMAKGLIDLSEF